MLESAMMFCFPWDFQDEGLDDLVRRARDLGLTHLAVATSYHAGYFFYAHNPKRRVHLLEDGVVYFHPDESCYAEGPIRPKIAEMSRQRDWIRDICDAAIGAGLKMVSWTVLLHNTRLGLLHPEATIANAFGDRHPHALSPAHPASIALAQGLVRDLASHYPFESLLLEAPNYRNRAHGGTWVSGHHHERCGTHLRPLEMSLLDLSFNDADVQQAEASGVDVQSLRSAIQSHLLRYFEAAPDVPVDLPGTIEQFQERHPALTELEAHYARAEKALLEALHGEAHSHGVTLIGSAKPAIDIVMAGAYGASAQRVAEVTASARAALQPHQKLMTALRMGFTSPGMGDPITTEQKMIDASRAVAENGADMIGFYNYAEAPPRCVQWIGPALRSGILEA
ncbi:MAG: hypothetical protein CMJ18_04190 [Phycisphaeraceae bacterium]|nr:hypothetical protein [Phycisphaeraceae bacterium]